MFKDSYGSWCVIAGGSDGIGEAFAKDAAARGLNLVLIARRPATLAASAAAIRDAHPEIEVRTLAVDLARAEAAEEIIAATEALEVGLLIYNVGSETDCGFLLDKPFDHWQGRLNRNFVTKTHLIHHFAGKMRDRRRGGVVLMGSTSGFMGGGGFALYAASKAFTHMLAEALWYEFREDGVDVICTIVGPTATPSMANAYGQRGGYQGDPADAARGTLDRLADDRGPIWVSDDIAGFCKEFSQMDPRARSLAGSKFCEDYVNNDGKGRSIRAA